MPDCRTCFAAHRNQQDKAKLIDDEHPNCACEQVSVSPYSPGLVEPEEYLLRVIYSPHHVEHDTGKLKPTALDDVSGRGLSVNRRRYTTPQETQQQISSKLDTAYAKEKGHRYVGVVVLNAGAVREISEQGKRLFGIYDTAEDDNRAHSDVCQVRLGRLAGQRARGELMKLLRSGVYPETLEAAFEDCPPAVSTRS